MSSFDVDRVLPSSARGIRYTAITVSETIVVIIYADGMVTAGRGIRPGSAAAAANGDGRMTGHPLPT